MAGGGRTTADPIPSAVDAPVGAAFAHRLVRGGGRSRHCARPKASTSARAPYPHCRPQQDGEGPVRLLGKAQPGQEGLVKLPVIDDELAACVSCGLCLPHCPTYRVTGLESASPRGRIAAMRAVHAGAAADDSFMEFMDLCVQCRGCEAACPSGVPFGRLMEGARRT